MFDDFICLVRRLFQTDQFIPLHAPTFQGNEKKYLVDTIDSTFVSSVGAYVDRFEAEIADYTGSKFAVAAVNGTAALHIALLLAGVKSGTEVITQPLTFIATCNAIKYCGAEPVFVDVDPGTLGLSPEHLDEYLGEHVTLRKGRAWNQTTKRYVSACLPMHTFGNPVDMEALAGVCEKYNLPIVEDAAESLGSKWHGRHTGTIGRIGILSFNGNKIITTGGGGMILTSVASLAKRARHITTTAKIPHPFQFVHDEIGYNYRMPNLNAALGVAQLEILPRLIENKRYLAEQYHKWCQQKGVLMIKEAKGAHSNAWLNALVLNDKTQRDAFLEKTNNSGIMTRPLWEPMHHLGIFKDCHQGDLTNSEWAAERVVNIPSSGQIK